MIRMVSHNVKGFVAGQPLNHGILFTSNYHTVRVPRHQSDHKCHPIKVTAAGIEYIELNLNSGVSRHYRMYNLTSYPTPSHLKNVSQH
jgi:hypothetical protein